MSIPRPDYRSIERGQTYLDEQAEKLRAGGVVLLPTRAKESTPGEVPPAWPAPQPLTAKITPEPCPVDALPETIREAVEEVAGFVKAPLPLVVSSAISALSIACQAHADVARADKLQGPSSLYLLTIADSGERKSTCDGFFSKAIRQYQDEQTEAMRPTVKQYQARLSAWEAEREGMLNAIREAAKKGQNTEGHKAELQRHETAKPEAPRVPRLLLGDETPESLAWSLAHRWPSSAVSSSEAATVFGSHGMGRDSIMRNLGLLNTLWDGAALSIGRKTSESFTVRGARLTCSLMVQEATLRDFLERAGALARGSGFLARFLVAWPESTQGTRMFSEAPANWPALAMFHQRIREILARPAPLNEDGTLSPALLTLTPGAKADWIRFHDAIETELASGGELADVKDVASKAADNAARLAALFHLFAGQGPAIGPESFEGASRIVAWHLSESRRFFGEMALPAELADAVRLDAWLVDYCRRNRTHMVSTREAQQYGPVRDKGRQDTALNVLEEFARVRQGNEARRKFVRVNPALLEGKP